MCQYFLVSALAFPSLQVTSVKFGDMPPTLAEFHQRAYTFHGYLVLFPIMLCYGLSLCACFKIGGKCNRQLQNMHQLESEHIAQVLKLAPLVTDPTCPSSNHLNNPPVWHLYITVAFDNPISSLGNQ